MENRYLTDKTIKTRKITQKKKITIENRNILF